MKVAAMAMAMRIANAMKEINGGMATKVSDSTLEWGEGAATVSASWYGHRPRYRVVALRGVRIGS